MMKIIDVGSNSVRLMTISDKVKTKSLKTTQLGRGLHETGRLGDKEMQDTIVAIGEFLGGDFGYVFATEAVRSSSNGSEFCKKVKALYGIEVDVLTKDEEARAGFLGASFGISPASVIDIGGASTEFASQNKDGFKSTSLPLGAVRLTDIKESGVDTVKYVCDILPDFSFESKIYAIGGTATSIALMVQDLTSYEVDKVHGYTLKAEDIDRLLDSLDGLCGNIYGRYPVIGKKRAEVIYEGIKLMSCITSRYGISELTVSDSDNAEGYILLRNL